MPNWKTVFGSFLKTEDLQGKAIRVVIDTVQMEEVKGEDGMERKLVARFAGKEKGLILNRTNCESIEELSGEADYEQWGGQTVVLFPTTTKFGAKTVPCLRVRAPQASAAKPAPPKPEPVEDVETFDDEIPFAWLMPFVLPLIGMGALLA